MAKKRLIVEKDGRTLAVDEDAYDDPAANPMNRERVVVNVGGPNGTERGRPEDQHVSLKAEGFKVIGEKTKDGGERYYEGDE
jgi:hypothetical protein